ncbi:hypothetical protein [Insolitispirillum peregrinum]|uniref:DNA/RNA non-specific endonuclease n=1 Tax=Insolitispirillum peregrinum TaxID=80876 RepID=A0A1N7IWT1_9PROT|nr:hypothetical protein [Insolitispirillum peregrinum]SIS41467.1 hypothetical protein SAMN05421779_101690 [Insolitispirillum peregrinum]
MSSQSYQNLNALIANQSHAEAVKILKCGLEALWLNAYEDSTSESYINTIDRSTFTVFFDIGNQAGGEASQEARVVGIFGLSCPPQDKRDANRMRGFLGPTAEVFGSSYDKGHFIAHSAGGDTLDSINWFPQERKLNRGWSDQGVRYREMETFCAKTPGTFMMAHPIYDGTSACPALLDFGILRDGVLEVCQFDNRPLTTSA